MRRRRRQLTIGCLTPALLKSCFDGSTVASFDGSTITLWPAHSLARERQAAQKIKIAARKAKIAPIPEARRAERLRREMQKYNSVARKPGGRVPQGNTTSRPWTRRTGKNA